ncbi:unnamed protein product [Ascophyllum nodosum]
MLPTLRQRSCTHGTLTLFILILAVVSLVNCLAFISTSLAATTSLPPSSPFRNRCTHDMGRCFVKRGGIEVWERCGRRKGNVGTWAQWGGKAAGVAARTTTRMISYNPNDELRAIVQRKQLEVENLLATHTADDDRLQMRLKYGASESSYVLRDALRRNKGQDQPHMTVAVADVKRRSPTSAELPPDVNAFDDAATWASQAGLPLYDAGARVLMVNTDGPAWGGSLSDLEGVLAHFKARGKNPPPIVMKDVIVHPMQMAQALEKGAAATVLIACVLGPALRDFMDVATTMGTEAIIEVHTPAECEKALEHGAGVIMINNWDRITGKLYPKQALGLRNMIPDQILTIASGGISSMEQAAELSDEGYDAVVLGRSLVAGGGRSPSGPELISGIVNRVGVPRNMLGWGLTAEDVAMDPRR